MKSIGTVIASAALVLSSIHAVHAQSNCPVLNGSFEYRTETDKTITVHTLTKYTRQDGEGTSYNVDLRGTFMPADEKKRPIKIGNRVGVIAMACRGGSLVQMLQEDGSADVTWTKIIPINDDEWEVDSNLTGRSGIYKRRQ